MATLTAKAPARAANAFALVAAAAGGDEFVNDGKCLIVIDNGSGGSITLTVETQRTVDGEAVDDKDIVLPAGEQHLLGPWPKPIYNDVDEKVQLTYSAVTDLTVGIIQHS